MSEQNKDNISQFFRKAVQKPKIEFVESDWEKLEAKLDAGLVAGPQKPNYWKSAFIAAIALLLVSTSLLLYTSLQVEKLTKKTKTDKDNVNAATETSTQALSKSEKSTPEQNELNSQEINKSEKTANHSSLLSSPTRKEVITPQSTGPSTTREQNQNSLQNASVKNETLFQSADLNNKTLSHDAGPLDNGTKVAAMNSSSEMEAINPTIASDSSSSEKQIDFIVNCGASLCDSLTETIKPKPSRWNVMLSLSPDFSTTDFDKFTTPGGAFGIAAYYAINNKFSISAGVVKSNKFYWDNGNEYKPNQTGYWDKKTNGIVPTKIEGSCSVLEIPIGLQYYFLSKKKSKLYIASTFSSYIMFNESYQYTFDAPNPGAAESWNAKKTSYSLFSIANLAVGYERSISNRIMIGVSPYLKIPMSGIGSWANIKLYSTGAAFTLRYQFQKKEKPDRLIPPAD
ncbi:MAG TPA: hypothetical protein VGQ59_20370 [Cyclobacteriaceae bacterium]|jgi:hypothetical protein|nr:hypothetical protein [Cyclobacteriaceae bacterium]